MRRIFHSAHFLFATTAALALLALLGAWQRPSAPAHPEDEPPYIILGYVRGQSNIDRIDATKLTHINYAFAQVNDQGEIYFRNPDSPSHMAQLQALKAKNPNLKILVSVGGWGADGFSDAALTQESRDKFSRTAVDMIKRYALDGIDIDWEFPAQEGPIEYRPEDTRNFTLMMQSLREHVDALSDERGLLGGDRLLLTIASNDDQEFIDTTEMDQVHVFLDYINIMTYDQSVRGMTSHHTGLYRSAHQNAPERTSSAAVERHLREGIPPQKLVLGTAFYGRGWRGANPQMNGLHQPYEEVAGAWGYQRLVDEFINKNGYTRYWDEAAQAPYLWNPETRTFVSYDDPASLRAKARFIKEKGLGGVMYWEHSHDPREVLLDALYQSLNRSSAR